MLMQFVWFVVGLVLLVVGAEALVRGASKIALSFGVSPLVIGMTIVAYGTSAPDMAVSVQGALTGQVDIAIGNVVGSNIFNVLFILGASALIAPLVVNAQLIRQEVPVMIGASLLLWALAADGRISGLGRSDQDSSPCSRPPQSHARTPAASRWMRGLLRGLGAGSSSQRRDRQRCPST